MSRRLLNCPGRIGVGRGALLLIVVGLLLSFVRPSAAQPAWTGVVTPIGTGVVRASRLAGDASGNAIAVWLAGTQTSSTVYAARFSAQSRTWAAPTMLDTTQWDDLDVVMSGAGDAIAIWKAAGGQLRAARFAAASGTWSAPVTTSGTQSASGPQASIDAQGNAVLVWSGFGAANARQVVAARFSAAAGSWAAPELVATVGVGSGAAASPRVVIDSLGNVSVLFLTSATSSRAMVMSRSNAGSNAWSSPQLVVQENTAPSELAVDASGNILALWSSGTSPSRLMAARYLASSGSWSQPQDLGPVFFGLGPRVLFDAAGNAVAVWVRGEGVSGRVLASSVFFASTGAWTPAPNLSAPRAGTVQPALTVDGTGVFTTAWIVEGPTLYAARRVASQPWTTPIPLFEGSGQLPSATASASGEVSVLAGLQTTRWSLQGAEGLAAPTGLAISTFITPYGEALIGEPLTVSWSPNATGLPVTGYQIEAGTATGLSDLASLRVGLVTQVAATVPVIRRIAIRVRAVNGNTVGPPSTEGFLVVAGVCEGQPAPRDLTSTVTGNLITLRWPATGLSTSYIVEAGSGAGLSNIASIPLGSNANRGISGAVGPGTYYIRVRAVGPCGTSNPSNEVVATIAGGPTALPGAPVLNAPVVSGRTVSLSWSAGSGPEPTGYVLTGSLTPDGAPIASIPLAGTSVSFAGAPSGTFYLRLIATNAAGSSPPSAAVTLVVP